MGINSYKLGSALLEGGRKQGADASEQLPKKSKVKEEKTLPKLLKQKLAYTYLNTHTDHALHEENNMNKVK